ncbi:Arc family DNA-binding protein [Variovorax sp. PvP013]|uniref:Arc family DNA-binding protein n=1 Tax=Variovorax sp. PvP013 TaxID=3156435 RepID=UPI003D1BB7EC
MTAPESSSEYISYVMAMKMTGEYHRTMAKDLPPSRTAPQFVVRLPNEAFRERLAEAAKANGRSMNSEIVSRLESSFQATSPRALKAGMQIALMESRVATVRANRAIEELRAETLVERIQKLKDAKSKANLPDVQVLTEQLDAAKAAEADLQAQYYKLLIQLKDMHTEDSSTKDSDID